MDRNVYEILHILCQNNGLKMKKIYWHLLYTYIIYYNIFHLYANGMLFYIRYDGCNIYKKRQIEISKYLVIFCLRYGSDIMYYNYGRHF